MDSKIARLQTWLDNEKIEKIAKRRHIGVKLICFFKKIIVPFSSSGNICAESEESFLSPHFVAEIIPAFW